MNYFEQSKIGESRWWSWLAVGWLTFVGWIIFQTIIMFPVPVIAGMKDPALVDAMFNAINANKATELSQRLTSLALFTGLGVTAAWLVALTHDGTARKISSLFASVGMGITIIASLIGSRGSDNSALMDVFSQMMAASPITFALFLLTFPAALIVLFLCQRGFHKRSVTALHTAASRFRWAHVLEGFFLTWIVLGLFSFVANALGIIEVSYVFAGGKFWIYAIVSLLFIPFQAATEEIVFRGYFNQGLAHLSGNKWIAFAVTSVAFMALHLSNPEALAGAASGTLPIVMSGYFFFGFAMCLIVWIDDGLETAIGIHAGNNCFAAIILNYENSVLPTPSVFLTGTDPVKDSITTVLVLGVLIAIVWWRRGGLPRQNLSG